MNYIAIEPEERARREKELRETVKRNAKYLKNAGFYSMSDPPSDDAERWCCGPVTIHIKEHDFESVADVTKTVHKMAFNKGQDSARTQIRNALGVI